MTNFVTTGDYDDDETSAQNLRRHSNMPISYS